MANQFDGKIKPFRFWVQSILPLVYDDSISYYELLCKVVETLNQVIAKTNQFDEFYEQLLRAYNELVQMVQEYLDNLDYESVIDAKLDEMAEDGTLAEISQPLISTVVAEWLSEHVGPTSPPVDSSLTISGAAADAKVTGDMLKECFSPFTNVAVTANNYSNILTNLNNAEVGKTYFINYNVTDAMIANMPAYGRSGILFTITSLRGNPHGLFQIFKTSNNVYTRLESGSGTTQNWSDWISSFDELADVIYAYRPQGNVVVSASTYAELLPDANNAEYGRSYFIHPAITDAMVQNLPYYGRAGVLFTLNALTQTNHGAVQIYINTVNLYTRFESGSGDTQNWSDWVSPYNAVGVAYQPFGNVVVRSTNYSSFFNDANAAENGKCYFIHYTVTEDMVAHLPEYGHNMILLTVNALTETVHGKFQVCQTGTHFYTRYEAGSGTTETWTDWWSSRVEFERSLFAGAIKSARIFKKIVCCGDSYTSGYINTTGTGADHPEYSWPTYLSDILSNTIVNCGFAGATSKSWLSNANGLTKARNSGRAQCYIVGLMLNDVNNVSLGTPADIGTNADSYYGYMSRIVRELAVISPKAHIFLLNCPRGGTAYTNYNQAVQTIVNTYASTYKVYLLDLVANVGLLQYEPFKSDFINNHFTALGYSQIAEVMCYLLSDYLNNHVPVFQDVYSIPYD